MASALRLRLQARAGLLAEPLGADLLVYDRRSDQVHGLAGAAAIVFARADGTTSLADVAATHAGPQAAVEVLAAAAQLVEAGLVQFVPDAAAPAVLDRLRALRRASLTAGVVASLLAPSAAMALSCAPSGHPCTGAPCCTICDEAQQPPRCL